MLHVFNRCVRLKVPKFYVRQKEREREKEKKKDEKKGAPEQRNYFFCHNGSMFKC